VETTGRDTKTAEIVEIAAVRERDGQIVGEYSSLVKPRVAMSVGARDTHGIADAELQGAPPFEDIWPAFREFCGADVIVAHNGYDFDFRILARMAREAGATFDLCTFDSLPLARDLIPTSRKLVDLARHFGIPPGSSHRALDDTIALAKVILALGEMKLARSRKTALVNLLDHLGVALALSEEDELGEEARVLRRIARSFALGPYSDCLEYYEREQGGDESIPTVDEVIARLGGRELMEKLRTVKSADERYPVAMARLRRIIADIPAGTLDEQLGVFLERVALSRLDGLEPERSRVNLLTLHSTKGLEFSRVYVVGAEDAEMPGESPNAPPRKREVEEARRLLYVGMTRTIDRLVLTRVAERGGKPTGGHQFLDEMNLTPEPAA
jgi:DNA polymerase III epsilon subunit-like protein